MGFLKNITSGDFLKNTLDGVNNIIDSTVTTDKERLAAKEKIYNLTTGLMNKAMQAREKIMVNETSGNWLQRSWRPITMLAFAFIVIYSKFIAPAFNLPNAQLEAPFWELLKLGLGGYVIGRSGEKMVKTLAGNLDKLPGKKNK